ncbi:SRPBCC family protein [Pseudonocardia sp. NPDC049154]|uniref:SRPBCC family protein n=1 Tax=Pseudonocardia sp. NPDC049154 TaxID=3155501 RepID=UPI0034007C5D
MNRFTTTTESEAVVAAERPGIWAVLTDPDLLPRLTPLLTSIETDGERWRWSMMRLAVLGVGIQPTFTERMRFTDGSEESRIDFTHEPPRDTHEFTGAEGWYRLRDVDGGTHLAIRLTLHVELPLSRLASPAVVGLMNVTLQRTGDRFVTNLLHHLDVDEVPGSRVTR